MDGDSEDKVSYGHHLINTEGTGQIENWKNNKILIKQADLDKLPADQRQGKYSSEKIESYFTLFESILAPDKILYWLLKT